jgi:1-acyl-sn-glycerol-3-phosphate acyltransferase
MSAARTRLAEPPAPGLDGAGPVTGLAPPPNGRDRGLLAALEPERRIDDWGRSERVESAFDAAVGEFLYRRWFRCAVAGVENVPDEGGALLAVNADGAVGAGALMIAKAVREEHPLARPVQIAVGARHRSVPGLSMLVEKLGGVVAHPANVERVLGEEGRLLLASPEVWRRPRPVGVERYDLSRFEVAGPIELALRSGAPIVPVCVVGVEEAWALLARTPVPGRLGALFDAPIRPLLPLLDPVRGAVCLPTRVEVRFLEPLASPRLSGDPAADAELARALAAELRERLQAGLLRIIATRRSTWRR